MCKAAILLSAVVSVGLAGITYAGGAACQASASASASPAPACGATVETPVAVTIAGGEEPSGSVTVSTEENVTISVSENGKQIKIVKNKDGIAVTHPDKDGKAVEVKAKDEAELKTTSPEAYELYSKYLGKDGKLKIEGLGGEGTTTFSGPRARLRINGRELPGFEGRYRTFTIPEMKGLSQEQRDELSKTLAEVEEKLQKARAELDAARAKMERDLRENQWKTQAAAREAVPSPYRLGISATSAEGVLKEQLGDGLVIGEVMPESRATKLGLKENDLLQSLNGKPTPTVEALREILTEAKDGPLTAEVIRKGQKVTLSLDGK